MPYINSHEPDIHYACKSDAKRSVDMFNMGSDTTTARVEYVKEKEPIAYDAMGYSL